MYKFLLTVLLVLPFSAFCLFQHEVNEAELINDKSSLDSAELSRRYALLDSLLEVGDEQAILTGVLEVSYFFRDHQENTARITFLIHRIDRLKSELSETSLSLIYDELGEAHRIKGDHALALDWLLKSLKMREKNRSDSLLTASYRRIGVLYGFQKNDSLSRVYFQKQFSKARELGQQKEIHSALINLGVASTSLGENEKALEYLYEALKLNLAYKYEEYSLADIFHNIGWAYDKAGQLDSSIFFYRKSLDIKNEIKAKNRAITHNNLGYVYYQQSALDSALSELILAEQLAMKNAERKLLHQVYANITNTYEKMEKYKPAFTYFNKYDTLGLKLFNEAKSRQITELQTKYETEKKDKELQLRQSKIDLTTAERDTLMYTLLVGLVLTLVIIVIYNQRQRINRRLRRKEQQLHEQEVNKLMQSQELKSINAMLEGEEKERKRIAEDLHDRVGSMLSAMKLQVDTADQKMTNLLDETADEVRRISHNLETRVLNRFGLIAALDDLSEKISSSKRVSFELQHLDLDERLDSKIEINAYRIVQELISNALKHSQATEITAQVNRVDSLLIIMVEDNGVGFDSQLAKQTDGMGLKNVKSRVNELDGNFNIDSGRRQGTIVTVELPL
ncbi:MAG: sensor histidine kinase [Reichenbachiella sp.]|uniref:tetratricopeptide repeat-containing sensor histidine kinase n=1 Tax=Reichenbachiella sp. TaxID=2184521 RepID=UPI0032676549